MNKQLVEARKLLIEASIKQNVDQVSALTGHLNECNYWLEEFVKEEALHAHEEAAPAPSEDEQPQA